MKSILAEHLKPVVFEVPQTRSRKSYAVKNAIRAWQESNPADKVWAVSPGKVIVASCHYDGQTHFHVRLWVDCS